MKPRKQTEGGMARWSKYVRWWGGKVKQVCERVGLQSGARMQECGMARWSKYVRGRVARWSKYLRGWGGKVEQICKKV